jgi:phosphatidylinositol glycan class S
VDNTDRVSLVSAASRARRAQQFADEAYTDGSLVSMLYFPDDQKHAIYIPLFLPVCLPVAFSLLSLIKHWMAVRRYKAKAE